MCLDYRKITSRRDELYKILEGLPEGDSQISNIEDQIKEMENQLSQNIKDLNSEGISEEEARTRDLGDFI
ncbi:MAG: hypothetical protein R3B55_02190 [Candidatus Paceibacterota bacterium]